MRGGKSKPTLVLLVQVGRHGLAQDVVGQLGDAIDAVGRRVRGRVLHCRLALVHGERGAGDSGEEETVPTITPAAMAVVPPPTVIGGHGRALLVMAAVLCLIAALLAFWL